MIKECQICRKNFEPIKNGHSRKYCFECSPIEDTNNIVMKRKKKELFVKLLGGSCVVCGYNRSMVGIDFHHIDPDTKSFTLGNSSKNLEVELKELKKCVPLCSNCHREHHSVGFDFEPVDYTLIDEHLDFVLYQDGSVCECGNHKHRQSTMCMECSNKKKQLVDRPEPVELAKLIVEHGFTGVGKMYGLSDNAIKKWCKGYGIPHLKKDLVAWYYKQ